MLTITIILLAAVFLSGGPPAHHRHSLGLVAGPVLSVVLGPAAGVTVVNGLSVVNAANNAWSVRDCTDWRRFSFLTGGLLIGSLPAVFVVMAIDGPWLMVTLGALVPLALSATMIKTDRMQLSENARVPMVIAVQPAAS